MEKIVALAKSRGFVYPGSEIYGGLANTWDYGNLGVELKTIIWPGLFSGGSLEAAGNSRIRQMIIHDITRLIVRLFFDEFNGTLPKRYLLL